MIISNYEICEEIGSGAFGTVNIAEDRTTGEKVAVKCISKSRIQRSNMGPQVKKEITTMKKLNHPNIVRIKEVLMSNSHLYLVLEYAGGGELFTKIARQGKLSENVAKRYFKQIMEAVKFCHNQYICHRDIKPENILLDSDDRVKIADFGFASIMEPEKGSDFGFDDEKRTRLSSIAENECNGDTIQPLRDFVPDCSDSPKVHKFKNMSSKIMQKMSTMCGTTQYMAPEIVNRDSYRGDKADIWSCGVVLFVLVTGYLPFDSKCSETIMEKIKNGQFDIPPSVSDLARNVILKLMTPNPLFRPGAKTILDHEWFRDITIPTIVPPKGNNREKHRLSIQNKETSKLVSKEERKAVLKKGLKDAMSLIVNVLRRNTWMQKLDCETESMSTVKGSKMTSTGLAMIQVVVQKTGNGTTAVEVEVFGKQKHSGAREINKLLTDIKALES
jgi:serine/threonine protein kinase